MSNLTEIDTVRQLKENFSPIKNTNIIHRKKLSHLEKLALYVTKKVGTLGFFIIIFIWTFAWLGWNIIAPENVRFDPYPAFALWLIISNLIQIHLMPLILLGQNIQNKHSELRAEHEFETSKKTEKEIETILLHLENQEKLIKELLEKHKKA